MSITIPQDWPGEDVNVAAWSTVARKHGQWDRLQTERVRVVHRATGAQSFSESVDGRRSLAVALVVARRRGRAYETVGLADLAVTVREWRRRGIPAG